MHGANMNLKAVRSLGNGTVVTYGERKKVDHHVRVGQVTSTADKSTRLEVVGGRGTPPE
tara:strand:+ start:327 stop:503 length:177 start_codon:yes stop_codon:yes gene_type:complete